MIQNGSTYANSTSVVLTLTAADITSGVDHVRLSNDDASWTSWEDFSESRDWTLSSGDGIKMVYYQIIDNAGLVSITRGNRIILDTTAPSLAFDDIDGTLFANRSMMIRWTSTDAWGIDHFACSFDGNSFASIGLAMQIGVVGLTDGMHNLSVRVVDYAGNIAQKNLEFIVDARLMLDIICDVPAGAFGSGVSITGNIRHMANATGVPGLSLMVYYSVTGGATWNEISSVTTGLNGGYSVLWLPTATGEYLIKVTWSGNTSLYPCDNQTNLAVTFYADKYVFAVQSNSIVSSLAFNSSRGELNFTVNGQPNSTGYARVLISKDLVKDAAKIKLYIDGRLANYELSSTTDSWVLLLTSGHNTSQISVSFGSSGKESNPATPSVLVVVLALLALVAIGILLVRRMRSG